MEHLLRLHIRTESVKVLTIAAVHGPLEKLPPLSIDINKGKHPPSSLSSATLEYAGLLVDSPEFVRSRSTNSTSQPLITCKN